MGTVCFHHLQEPGLHRQRSSQLNVTSSTENPLTTSGNQYKENVISEMKSKKINARRFCRQSKVIVEQREQSVYTRDTEHRQNYLSDISGNYETVNFVNCQSAAVSMFLQNQQVGQRLKIGDTVLLKNLKEKSFLHCKYQRLKKLSKQNLVKLEQERDDMNEMYLTWKITTENDKDNGSDVLNQQKIKLEHTLTGCYLQTSKSYKFEQSLAVGSCGQVVSCGQSNKITKDQIWQLEFMNPTGQHISVNDLFRIKHTETGMYFASYQQQVCCLDQCDLEMHRILEYCDQALESAIHSEIQDNQGIIQKEDNNNNINKTKQNDNNQKGQINKEQLSENELNNHQSDEEKTSETLKKPNEDDNRQQGANMELKIEKNEMTNQQCNSSTDPQNLDKQDAIQQKKDQFHQIIKDAEIWYVAEVISKV